MARMMGSPGVKYLIKKIPNLSFDAHHGAVYVMRRTMTGVNNLLIVMTNVKNLIKTTWIVKYLLSSCALSWKIWN